jgi:hypothetical protein
LKYEKINKLEEESLVQISHFFELNSDFKAIEKMYKQNAEFSKSYFWYYIIVIAVVLLLSFFYVFNSFNKADQKVNVFDQKEVVFNEIYFSRSVVYKNKFSTENDLFLKQALFYFSGKIHVAFDPKKIVYNPMDNSITYNEDFNFKMDSSYKILDLLNPEKITSEQSAKISAMIGVVGGVAGLKVGSMLTSSIGLTPLISASTGAVIGGLSAAYFTFNSLNGLNIQKELSETEKNEVFRLGKDLIYYAIISDEQVKNIVYSDFKRSITAAYVAKGLVVKDINIGGKLK